MFFTLVVTSSCALSIAGGDVLLTRSTGIFVVGVVVVVQVPRGDGCTARRSVQHGCHGRSGSLTVLLGASAGAEAAARSASSVRALACLLALQINALHPLFTLASVLRPASSKF